MYEDVAFRMPVWILSDTAKGLDRSEDAKLIDGFQEPEGNRGHRRLTEDATQLPRDPLWRKPVQIDPTTESFEAIVDAGVKASTQPGHSNYAQRVIGEGLFGDRAKSPSFETGSTRLRVSKKMLSGLMSRCQHPRPCM